jgi:hypothetical protein
MSGSNNTPSSCSYRFSNIASKLAKLTLGIAVAGGLTYGVLHLLPLIGLATVAAATCKFIGLISTAFAAIATASYLGRFIYFNTRRSLSPEFFKTLKNDGADSTVPSFENIHCHMESDTMQIKKDVLTLEPGEKKCFILGMETGHNLCTGNKGHFILMTLEKNASGDITIKLDDPYGNDPLNYFKKGSFYKFINMIFPNDCTYDPKEAVINTIAKENNLGKQARYDFKRCGYYCLEMALAETHDSTSPSTPPHTVTTIYNLIEKERVQIRNKQMENDGNYYDSSDDDF